MRPRRVAYLRWDNTGALPCSVCSMSMSFVGDVGEIRVGG